MTRSPWTITRTFLVFVVVVALGLSANVLTAGAATTTPLWVGDFRTGDTSQWMKIHAARSDAVAVVTSPVRPGYSHAGRFTVKPGDNWYSSDTERAEVTAGMAKTDAYEGRRQYYAWSLLFPTGTKVAPGDWMIFTQWHQQTDNCPPNVAFHVTSDATPRVKLSVRGGSFNPSTCDNSFRKGYDLGPLPVGSWADFRVDVTWSADPAKGRMEVRLGDRTVLASTPMANLYVGEGAYLKQGIYRGNMDVTTTMYLTGTVRGATPESVILAGSPAPTPTATASPAPTQTASPAPTETTSPAPTETTSPAPTQTTSPAPTQTTAPAPAAFSDDFSTQDAAKWSYRSGTSATGGRFVATPTSGTTYPSADNAVFGKRNMTGTAETVELVKTPDAVGGKSNAQFQVRTSGTDGYRFVWHNGRLYAQVRSAGATTSSLSVPYTATQHRWLRIRHAGTSATTGMVHFEASPDGTDWSAAPIHSVQNTQDVSGVHGYLAAGWDDTSTLPPGSAVFDNYSSGSTTAPAPAPTVAPTTSPVPAPSVPADGVVARINAGGGSVLDGGQAWSADTGFLGGTSADFPSAQVDSSTPLVDRSERWGAQGYDIPVPAAGTYRLRLSATELRWTAPGRRVFDIAVEGERLVTSLDLYAAMGKDRAWLLDVPVTVTDGSLTIRFTATVDQPTVSGIEVLTAPLPTATPSEPGSTDATCSRGRSVKFRDSELGPATFCQRK